jgi:predicted RNA binding protein YcfA (HicA-like mRNA interferase family)
MDEYQVVVPHHNRDLKKGTIMQIIKGTGLSLDEFKTYL